MQIIKSSFITLAVVSLIGFSHLANANKDVVVPDDGLILVQSTDTTIIYTKENLDLSTFENVFIIPSKVAFKKNWKRSYNNSQGSAFQRLTDKDVTELQTDVATFFDEVFKEELDKNAVLTIVETNNAEALILKPYIINLDLNAPDTKTSSNARTYVKSTGEATLYLEIFDGKTGEILARIIDDRPIGDDSFAKWASRAQNKADARRTIKKWAESLNESFKSSRTPTT